MNETKKDSVPADRQVQGWRETANEAVAKTLHELDGDGYHWENSPNANNYRMDADDALKAALTALAESEAFYDAVAEAIYKAGAVDETPAGNVLALLCGDREEER